MKTFIISLCSLITIFIFTIINGIYVSRTTSLLIDKAKRMDNDVVSVLSFAQEWEKHQFLIRISSSHKETHRIDEALSILKEKARNNVPDGFNEERALLIEYLTQIKEDETVSLDSII